MAEQLHIPTQTWYLCDLVSGKWYFRLPILAESVTVNMAEINKTSLTLQVAEDACPDEWLEYLTPAYNRMIVLCLDEQPVQGWWIDGDVEVGDWTVTIPVSTLEACYDNANVPELYETLDDVQAAVNLCITDVGPDGVATGLGGMGARFGFIHEFALSGNISDHNYSAAETKTIYAALKAMMDDGRIEFRCLVRWADSEHLTFKKVTQIRYRVGVTRQDSVFSYSIALDGQAVGSVAKYTRVIGRGATVVTGTATVQGSANVVNPPEAATTEINNGFPIVEERRTYDGLDVDTTPVVGAGGIGGPVSGGTPGPDITAALRARQQATLQAKRGGVITWSFELRPGTLLPGQDFDPGDTCPFKIAPRVKVDPVGGSGDSRLLGFTLRLSDMVVTPTLWPPPEVSS